MRVDIITLFPELFEVPLRTALLGRGIERGLLDVRVHQLRDHGLGKHRTVDDQPYGGGAGMVLRPEPLFDAVDALRTPETRVILLSPRGSRLDQPACARIATYRHSILICGRYEGVDERVSEHLVDEEISIGDFVLSGGELPALVLLEAVTRLVPGVLGNEDSLSSESHTQAGLEYPHYTRPPTYRDMDVPEVLLSGDHGAIERWRAQQARRVTEERRPDLLG